MVVKELSQSFYLWTLFFGPSLEQSLASSVIILWFFGLFGIVLAMPPAPDHGISKIDISKAVKRYCLSFSSLLDKSLNNLIELVAKLVYY